MNTNVLKGIEACRGAIDNESAKIGKMQVILLDLKKKYQLICKRCSCASNLKDFVSLTTYHHDNDGDCHASGFTDNHLVCPRCSAHNRVLNHPQKDELLKILDGSTWNVFPATGDIYYIDHTPWV